MKLFTFVLICILQLSSAFLSHTSVTTTSLIHSEYLRNDFVESRNHYQTLFLCDTSPTILKCQNKQHYLLVYKIMLGLSALGDNDQCLPSKTKKENCVVESSQSYNCTGSNICLYYPEIRELKFCRNFSTITSNLTQIYLTCVNLNNLKKYLLHQRNLKPKNQLFIELKEVNQHNLNNSSFRNLSSNQSTNSLLKSLFYYNDLDISRDSIIILSIVMFCSFCAIILSSLIYYRIRIRQILRHTPCSISNQLRKQRKQESEIQHQQENTTFSSFFTQQSMPTSEPVSESFSENQSNDLSVKKKIESSVTVNLNHRILSFLTSLFSLMRKLPEQSENHSNDLIRISPQTEKIFTLETKSNTNRKEESPISKLPFKINTNNEYYDYDDILTYFKSPTQSSHTNTKLNKLRLIENNPCNKIESQSNDKLPHVLYDIPEEEADDDSNGICAKFKPEKYVFNLDEILKI